MQRREFLKLAGLSLLSTSFQLEKLFAQSLREAKRVELTYIAKLPFEDKRVRLWFPLPMNTSYQYLEALEMKGSFSNFLITQDRIYKSPTFYAEFEKGASKWVELKMRVTLFERAPVDFSKLKPNNESIPDEVRLFLKATPHIPTGGVVKETAKKVTKGLKTDLEKARALYEWVVENTYRDPKVKGCGIGDAGKALATGQLGGKCTDISSIYVALLRAAGIPAREIFGLRVLPSSLSPAISNVKEDAAQAQHCKVEFYLNGWIPADPADVRKFMLGEKINEVKDPRVQKVKEFLFGGWDNHWVMFNYARDFALEPAPASKEAINEFMYPQGEVEGTLIDKLELTFEYSKYKVKAL